MRLRFVGIFVAAVVIVFFAFLSMRNETTLFQPKTEPLERIESLEKIEPEKTSGKELYFLATDLEATGNMVQAKDTYKKIITDFPNFRGDLPRCRFSACPGLQSLVSF